MTQSERGIVAFFMAWGVFILNAAGGYFSWYSSIWWYDMLMHFSGGMMIGTVALLFAFSFHMTWFGSSVAPQYVRILLPIIFAIIAWELMEFTLSSMGGDIFHIIDSISDMCLGLSGALFVLSQTSVIEPLRQ